MACERNSQDIECNFVSASIWLALTAMVGVFVVAAAWACGLHVGFHARQTGTAAAELLFAASLAIVCRNVAPRWAAAIGSFAMLAFSGVAAGVLSDVGQMFAFPLVDASLAAADELLRFRTIDVVRAVVQIRNGPAILAMLYELATPMLFVTAFALAFLGRFTRLWEMCAAFSFCILVATVTSCLFPAVGAFEHSGIAAAYGSHLPGGAGVYHLKIFYALRGASDLTIDPFALEGIVTFPSFHTAMALMTAAAWRDDPYLRGPMIVWNAGVIVSTIPIGGHYVVDLAGGALAWFLVYRFGPSWAEAVRSVVALRRLQPQAA